MSNIIFLLITVMFAASGQILVKKGINSLGQIEFTSGLVAAYFKIFTSPFVISGTLLYTFSIFLWLYILSKVDLSFAAPFLAFTYVLFMLGSWLVLGESIPIMRWIGIFVICVGLLLTSSAK